MLIGIGIAIGVVITAGAVWMLMPRLMIRQMRSGQGFDETVQAVNSGIERAGWSSPGMLDMQQSITKHGEPFDRRVKVIQLCHPRYAASVLLTDRPLAAMMPCAIAVYEGDDGKVYISKLNTGLMGKMFGGNVAKIMGGLVAKDEQSILDGVTAG